MLGVSVQLFFLGIKYRDLFVYKKVKLSFIMFWLTQSIAIEYLSHSTERES